MIRTEIFNQVNDYLGIQYYQKKIITSDDMIMNVVSYQFANNYSNINLPGYLYIKRKKSMSRGGGRKLKELRSKNYYFYFQLFYKYIKDFNKDINILFFEMQNLERFIIQFKNSNLTKYKRVQQNLLKQILKENTLTNEFETYLQNLSIYLKI